MSNNRRKLAGVALGGHIAAVILLWFLLRDENIQEPVFEKVISVNITTKVPSLAPPLNQATRDKIEKERRQNEEAAWKKQQLSMKKKHEAEAKKIKEAEARKAAEAEKIKAEAKKKEVVKKKEEIKKQQDKKKKEEIKKQQELAARKAAETKKIKEAKDRAERAERIRKEKMAAAQKAAAEAKIRENAKQQTILGKHVTADIVSRLTVEWNRGTNSAIQFNDPNDFVTIQITVNRNGSLISARVTKTAKSANLNAKAAALIAIISRPGYKFPPFDKAYNKTSITLSRNFRTK